MCKVQWKFITKIWKIWMSKRQIEYVTNVQDNFMSKVQTIICISYKLNMLNVWQSNKVNVWLSYKWNVSLN
jgi:hypothetical protein